MIDLFSPPVIEPKIVDLQGHIDGLSLVKNLVSDFEHDKLIISIDEKEWSNELKRRVQHYGYKYNYKSRSITSEMEADPIPNWALEIGIKLRDLGVFDTVPDQLIINEYLPGQGISEHIDCEPCFLDTVVSLSLGSSAVMKFTKKDSNRKVEIPLMINDAIVLKKDARYKWKHSIPGRKSDIIDGLKIERRRRISLTFRNVIID